MLLGCTAAAMLPKKARGTFRKHISKPSEQVAALPSNWIRLGDDGKHLSLNDWNGVTQVLANREGAGEVEVDGVSVVVGHLPLHGNIGFCVVVLRAGSLLLRFGFTVLIGYYDYHPVTKSPEIGYCECFSNVPNSILLL